MQDQFEWGRQAFLQGVSCFERGALAEAEAAFVQALQHVPGRASVLLNLGLTRVRLQRHADAVPVLQQALAAEAEAAAAYRNGQAHGADAAWASYLLAAVTHSGDVARAPLGYVRNLFDDYAADFDHHLVDQLGYQGHRTLVASLPVPAGAPLGRVLDLGCGTGLCGTLVRSRASHLTGVDVSPDMVAKANERGLYDCLQEADLHRFLSDTDQTWDVVLAADVFIYVGALDQAFALLQPRVSTGGWLAFTVEAGAPGTGARLLPSLRYSHAPDYLRNLADRNGFDWHSTRSAPIRYDQRQPVSGDYVVLRRR